MRHVVVYSQEGEETEREVSSLDLDDVEEALADLFDDAIYANVDAEQGWPCGYFPDPNKILSAVYSSVRKRLHERFASLSVCVRTIETDGCITGTSPLDSVALIDRAVDAPEDSEKGYIGTGSVIIRMLTQFLNRGIWQYGLRNGQGDVLCDVWQWPKPNMDGGIPSWRGPTGLLLSPVIWFGLENESPIECWSLSLDPKQFEKLNLYEYPCSTAPRPVERWQSFWFCTFWCFDWNALFENRGCAYSTWMFAECGMAEPADELNRVRQACPITLDDADTGEALTEKINEFFVSRYSAVRQQ